MNIILLVTNRSRVVEGQGAVNSIGLYGQVMPPNR